MEKLKGVHIGKHPYIILSKKRKYCNESDYESDASSDMDYESDASSDMDYDSNALQMFKSKKKKDNRNIYVRGNHIYFKADVTDKSITELIDIINKYEKEFEKLKKNPMIESALPKPLWLHITSNGGSLFACFRSIDVIKNCKIQINTIIDGYAASAGSVMAVVGAKRFMTENSYCLMHQLSYDMGGKFVELQDNYKNTKRWMKKLTNIYKEYTNMDEEQIKKQLKHDSWWDTEKCLEVGLVDEIWTNNENT
jgi:ATP-dependent protease ClpP protease subunit